MSAYSESLALVLDECDEALKQVDIAKVEKFIELLLIAERVFFVGTGRVLLSLQSMSTRLRHVGLETYHVGQTAEPPITERDLLIIGSGSGESIFPVAVAKRAKELGVRIVHIGSNPMSSLKDITDLFIRIPARTKLNLADEIDSKQPMSSLFEQCLLLFGDIVANMLIHRKGLTPATLWSRHANLE
jgi:6-phospho-3-hexuloisomerase